MRVLLATPFMSQHFDSGLLWAKALCELGHALILWDYRVSPQMPPGQWDLSLVMKGESIDPQQLPKPRFCYFPDAFERFPGIERTLEQYDRVYTPVRPTPAGMVWLPSGYDPDIHRYNGSKRDIPSLYIGTCNSERKVDFIMGIAPRMIAGNGWAELRGRLALQRAWSPAMDGVQVTNPEYLHDFVALASRAQVAINIHQGDVGVNRKGIELSQCCFTLYDDVPGIAGILGPKLMAKVSFRTPVEGKDLVEYYLCHPEEREMLWLQERAEFQPFSYLNCTRRVLNA